LEKIGSFKDINISDIISIIDVNIKGMTAINRDLSSLYEKRKL